MCQRSVRFPRLYLGLASAAAARQPATRRHRAAAIRVLLSTSLCDGAQISSVLLFVEFCGNFSRYLGVRCLKSSKRMTQKLHAEYCDSPQSVAALRCDVNPS